jgi:hypothetical protein
MRLRLLLAAAAIAMVSPAQAQGLKIERTYIAPNDFSCGKWINAPNATERLLMQVWVNGYLSGVNAENAYTDLLRGKDGNGIAAWMDSYCLRNPLQPMTKALDVLVKELHAEQCPACGPR